MLETPRLILRDFLPTDVEAVHRYASDPRVVVYQDWGPNTLLETQDFIRRMLEINGSEPRLAFHFAVVLKDSGELIGGCSLWVPKLSNSEGLIGYVLHPDHWGRGIATEASRGLLRHGFTALQLHRISATCDPGNTASARVLEKLGMKREGHLREHIRTRDYWRDSLVYGILDREWDGAG
jgi:RimJ/RimL family protein N-acetyltransferase